MVLKKQTVWLLTMLTLMIALAVYYIFNPPTGEDVMPAIGDDDAAWEDPLINADSDFNFPSLDAADFFISYRLERDTLRARQLDQYDQLLSSDATAQVIAEAKEKRDKIYDLADAELTIESLLRADGFEEAVVIANEDRVNVVIRSEHVDRKQVLDIIHLVRKHLPVNGNQVTVDVK